MEGEEELVLKVQGAGGARVLRMSAAAGVGELRAAAASALALGGGVRLLAGRPPRPLPQAASLRAAGLASGDTLLAEADEPPPPAPARPAYRGLLLKRVVPSDNSCLFTSVGFVMNGKVDPSLAPYMRKIIADVVAADEINYSDALLGKPNRDYCDWIQRPDSWGGAIEISVLSNLYGLEIDVVNVLHALVNRFGEDKDYGQRVFLLFDGIHYDPLFAEREDGAIQTIFPIEDEDTLNDAEQLAKSSQPYTDVDNFQTKCLVCDAVLIGQKNANRHAVETNHTSFSEI